MPPRNPATGHFLTGPPAPTPRDPKTGHFLKPGQQAIQSVGSGAHLPTSTSDSTAQADTPREAESPRLARLEAENARLAKLLGLVDSYRAGARKPPEWLRPKTTAAPKAATACIQLSDLHLDEVVEPGQVGGLNAFNREIAEMRLRRWADKACELGELHRHEWDGAIVWWGGDMVSGSIHDELRETNADYLPGTLVHWAPLLAAAIKQVADAYGNAHVPCVVGNHGRLTEKKQAKGRGRNSWDWLLCEMVKAHLASDERITWDVSEGSYLFVPVYDRTVYLTHGDEVGGGGGWAGVWSPLGTIHRRGLELGHAYDLRPSYSVVGHWHQTVLAHARGLVCNGALKGWDEYAAGLRLRPEPAQQNWWVETPSHGTTLAASLFLEDRAKEGW